MRLNKLAAMLLLGVSGLGLIQHIWYWTQLPEVVATHFGPNGQPNDWMSKSAATLLLCVFQIGLPWAFLMLAALLHRFPNWSINVPHREYWLHPDRRDATLARVTSMLSWLAVLTSLFIMVMSHLTFQANMAGGGLNLPVFGVALATYLVVTVVMALGSMPSRPPRGATVS